MKSIRVVDVITTTVTRETWAQRWDVQATYGQGPDGSGNSMIPISLSRVQGLEALYAMRIR